MSEQERRVQQILTASRARREDADRVLLAFKALELNPDAAVQISLLPKNRLAMLRARFIRGDIDEAQFISSMRKLTALAGLGFGLLFWVFMTLLIGIGEGATAAMLGATSVVYLAAGPGFALMMYLLVVAPQARRLIRQVHKGTIRAPIAPTVGTCPCCGDRDSTHYGPRHPTMVHWVLNPGLVVNDLALGQRLPGSHHLCNGCGGAFVDCHACGLSIDALEWPEKKFGNWSGLHCPHCNAEVPSLRNGLAWVIETPWRLLRK